MVEIQRSETQQIVLVNDTGGEVGIERADRSAPAMRLAPGATLLAPMTVASVAPLETAAGLPWQRISANGVNHHVLPPVSPYLKIQGLALEVGLRQADGTFRPILFSLEDCMPGWQEKRAPAAELHVALSAALQRPAGTDIRLCPGGIVQ